MAKPQKRAKARYAKRVLRIPDPEHSRQAVNNSLPAKTFQESCAHAIEETIRWYRSEPRLAFNRTIVLRYRFFPEQSNQAPSTERIRMQVHPVCRSYAFNEYSLVSRVPVELSSKSQRSHSVR
jgi:hypothetical protein